jgi:tRNA-dihydrouridine synthase A
MRREKTIKHKFSVAPMMDWTDKHCRYFYRLMSKKTQLWSEMVTAKAIIHGDKNRLLDFDASEQPLVLQLGGSDPKEMAIAAKVGQDWGYEEININVGCPSERVRSGSFGACLMQTPHTVADCIEAMGAVINIPLSVKCRIGVDAMEHYEALANFIQIVHQAGCENFVIHARKAWLKGLSPKQNRSVPPLNYAWVYQIKQDFPQLNITINGGIESLNQANLHLRQVDGAMLGRAIYHQPYLLAQVDTIIYQQTTPIISREQVLLDFIHYMQRQHLNGVPIRSMTRHILGLYHAEANAKKFKRLLSGKVVEIAHLHEWLDIRDKNVV